MRKLIKLVNCPNKRLLLRALRRSTFHGRHTSVDLESNLRSTYNWLCEAQDATPDAGVSAGYSLVTGWSASYPETTGYIIPTFLAYATVMNDAEARERAIRMADWEIKVQMPSGAVQSSTVELEPTAAVFNTAQVLEGWTSVYRATEEVRFAESAHRAARWLVDGMDDDGAWRKDLSVLAISDLHTYNVLSASRLSQAGHVFNEPTWVDAARKNTEWTITQQQDNGWFQNSTMIKGTPPILHPIVYTLEGLLNMGIQYGEPRYIDAVTTVVRVMMSKISAGRQLSGAYDSNWNEAVSWRCLTGEAQFAIILYRLAMYCDQNGHQKRTADDIIEQLGRIQDVDSPYPENRGAIAGSFPYWGGYGRFEYPNWAAKYYLDALLLGIKGTDPHPLPSQDGFAGKSQRKSFRVQKT